MYGQLLRTYRHRFGLTQEELADKAGVSARSIRDVETGRILRPRAATVSRLADALGLYGADRDRFCQQALAGTGDTGPPGTGEPHRRSPVPAQLPGGTGCFVGRDAVLRQLDTLLAGSPLAGSPLAGSPLADARMPDTQPMRPAGPAIAVLTGAAGIGKTTLAVHWAHRVSERFPDGQLYVDLRGFDPYGRALDADEAVLGFLDALGVAPDQVPAQPQARVGLYRSVLAGRRVLILLDNARGYEHVGPLLPATAGCVCVVTSRMTLTGLLTTHGAQTLRLDLLPAGEARRLLADRLGDRRVADEPDAVARIVSSCAGLPLALTIAGSRAASRPEFPLWTIAEELGDAATDLTAFDGGDATADVRAVLSWSYRVLGPPAARLFRLLAQAPGPDLTTATATSLAGGPARAAMSELSRANLVTERAPGRYAMHDLLRAYATELAATVETMPQRQAATRRVLEHYAGTAHAAARLLSPHRAPVAPPAAGPGVVPEPIADHDRALAWFTAERANLLAAVTLAAGVGADTVVCDLAWALTDFLQRQGHWLEQAAVHRAALDAAGRLGDRPARARFHRHLGRAYTLLRRYDHAGREYQHALRLVTDLDDANGAAQTHMNLANLWEQRGRDDRALAHAERAMHRFRHAGVRVGEARTLNMVGWFQARLGRYGPALTACRQALDLLRELGDGQGQADTLDSLGYIYQHDGEYTLAIDCYRQAIALTDHLGNRFLGAIVESHLGAAYRAAGDPDAARTALRTALTALTELGHPAAADIQAQLAELDSTA